MRYAIINSSNIVVNIVKWDGVTQWAPPNNHIAIATSMGQIGNIYDPEEDTFSYVQEAQ